MENEWYFKEGGRTHGPITSRQLKKLLDMGRIVETTEVRRGEQGSWVHAGALRMRIAEGGVSGESAASASVVNVQTDTGPGRKSLRVQNSLQPQRIEFQDAPKPSQKSNRLLAYSCIGIVAGILGIAFALTFLGPSGHRGRDSQDLAALIAAVEPSVVRIDTKTAGGRGALGSGFVASPDGQIVTNFHVIGDAASAEVHFSDGTICEVESVLAFDQSLDIAVLKIKRPKRLRAVQFAKAAPRKGAFALALGMPKGFSFTATEGIVSAVRSGAEFEEISGTKRSGTWIQTSASITSGNSGGPLFDRQGQVIGMNTFVVTDSGNLGFAVSSLDIADALTKIDATTVGSLLPLKTTTSSWLGDDDTTMSKLAPELQKRLKSAKEEILQATARRKTELDAAAADIDTSHKLLKLAVIGADPVEEQRCRTQIERRQSDIRRLLDQPLTLPALNPASFKSFQVGHLGSRNLRVVQVLDKASGSILVSDSRADRSRLIVFRLHGIDALDIVDGDNVKMVPQLVFFIAGTDTYTTIAGSTNTVFELWCVGDTSKSDMYSSYRKVVDTSINVSLLT